MLVQQNDRTLMIALGYDDLMIPQVMGGVNMPERKYNIIQCVQHTVY